MAQNRFCYNNPPLTTNISLDKHAHNRTEICNRKDKKDTALNRAVG